MDKPKRYPGVVIVGGGAGGGQGMTSPIQHVGQSGCHVTISTREAESTVWAVPHRVGINLDAEGRIVGFVVRDLHKPL